MSKLQQGAQKAKAPKKLGRNAVNSAGASRARSVVSKSSELGTAITVSDALQATLKGIDGLHVAGARANRDCNALGHIIDTNDVLGGKNVRVDVLVIKAVQTGNVTFSMVYDELVGAKVVGAKVYTRPAMLKKWRAHRNHFAGAKSAKVQFIPLVPVAGADLVDVMNQVNSMVEVVLKG